MTTIRKYPDGWIASRADGSYYGWFPGASAAMLRGGPYPKHPMVWTLNRFTGMVNRFIRGY